MYSLSDILHPQSNVEEVVGTLLVQVRSAQGVDLFALLFQYNDDIVHDDQLKKVVGGNGSYSCNCYYRLVGDDPGLDDRKLDIDGVYDSDQCKEQCERACYTSAIRTGCHL